MGCFDFRHVMSKAGPDMPGLTHIQRTLRRDTKVFAARAGKGAALLGQACPGRPHGIAPSLDEPAVTSEIGTTFMPARITLRVAVDPATAPAAANGRSRAVKPVYPCVLASS
jgi:hypothetical protein